MRLISWELQIDTHKGLDGWGGLDGLDSLADWCFEEVRELLYRIMVCKSTHNDIKLGTCHCVLVRKTWSLEASQESRFKNLWSYQCLSITGEIWLVQQIRRAILSVSSNLSEGSGRQSPKDQSHFYTMAYSSLLEVLNQLIFALDQNWIKPEDYQDLRNDISKLTFMINALRNSLNYQLTNKLNPLNHSKPSNLTLRSRSIG